MKPDQKESDTGTSFDNLLRDVIDRGLCNRCGACVSFCTAGQIGAIEMCSCEDNLPRYLDRDKCLKCGICYLICPQTQELNEEVAEKFGRSTPTGPLQDILPAQATDEKIREVATDGGVVTALLSYMLDKKIIDGAIVSKRTGLFDREPEIVTTREGLIEAAGSQFSETSHLDEMGKEYSTYVPILPAVKMFGPKRSVKLAVVGTPCQINAIRKMQVLNILPSDVVHFTIGLFCMQCFTFEKLMEKEFIKKYHISLDDILKINVKEDFRLKLKSGVTIHIPFEEIEDIVRPACLVCSDFANDFADISVGGLGSAEGYTTSMIRTSMAKRIFTGAVNDGYLKPVDVTEKEKTRMLSMVQAFVERKIRRAKRTAEILKLSESREEPAGSPEDKEKRTLDSLNKSQLCAECEELNRHLKWMMGFVSHELSGTLGTTIMNVSALADPEVAKRLDEEKKKKLLSGALTSLKLMQDMVRNYLTSSKVRDGQLSFNPIRVSIGKDIVDGVIRRLDSSLKAKNMEFICDGCDEFQAICDKRLIRVAINNLINNAIKYGHANTEIHSSMKKWKNGFEYTITGEGIGVPEDKLEAIFEEFTRFDPLGTGGTGLGLCLVRKIATMHNGDIRANAGYILDGKHVTYEMITKNPDVYAIEPENKELRRFATFVLRISGHALSGSTHGEKGGN
jgi:coenzyme F420 hydrogenase subunit beta